MSRYISVGGMIAATTVAWASFASAADLPAKAPVLKAAEVVSNWTGPYIGISVGGRWTDTDWRTTCIGGTAACPVNGIFPAFLANNNPAGFDSSGFRGGVYGGYNWQVSPQWVIGLEGDIAWADSKRTIGGIPGTLAFGLVPNPLDSSSVKANWDASLRGRIGFLVTPALMLFGTGGASWLNQTASASCVAAPAASWCFNAVNRGLSQSVSATRIGWTAGAGLEYLFASNWLARAEYRYADYDSFGSTFFPGGAVAPGIDIVTFNVKTRTHTANFGIAYKFGGPVVARY